MQTQVALSLLASRFFRLLPLSPKIWCANLRGRAHVCTTFKSVQPIRAHLYQPRACDGRVDYSIPAINVTCDLLMRTPACRWVGAVVLCESSAPESTLGKTHAWTMYCLVQPTYSNVVFPRCKRLGVMFCHDRAVGSFLTGLVWACMQVSTRVQTAKGSTAPQM